MQLSFRRDVVVDVDEDPQSYEDRIAVLVYALSLLSPGDLKRWLDETGHRHHQFPTINMVQVGLHKYYKAKEG